MTLYSNVTREEVRYKPRPTMTTFRLLLFASVVLSAPAAWAQYVATPQAGVPYPALTNPTQVPLVAVGTNDPKDRGRATIPIGFDFPLYNRVYSQVTITANGVLFFEPSTGANTSSDFSGNVALPSGAEPNAVLAPLWDDLIGNLSTSALQTQAVTGPNGQGLAVEFKDWNRSFGTFTLNFQVRFWANGIIEFFYGTMTGSGATNITATIGIESPSGTAGTRGLTNCTTDCSLTSFDPGGTGTPITYIRFGPPAGVDLQALNLRIDGMTQDAGDLSIATTFTLRNFGTQGSAPFIYELYLSEDTLVDGNDLLMTPPPAPQSLGSLVVANTSATGTVSRPDGGSWYVLASIPTDGGEVNVFNNVVASSVPYAAGVDLIAEAVRPPPVGGPGDPISIGVQFSNQGFEPAGNVAVKLFVSVDNQLSVDDRLLTTQNIPILGGQQVQQNVTFSIPGTTPAGDYYVLMVLDDGPNVGAIVERSEANNVIPSATQLQVRQADLAVLAVRVMRAQAPFDQVSNVFFGETARFEAQVSNLGGATANNVVISFFLSDNESLNAVTDTFVGSVGGLTFAPGDTRWVTLPSATVPTTNVSGQTLPVQPYFFFGAATAPGSTETNPANNFEKSAPVVLRNPAPNLLPVEMQTPARAGAGELIVVSRTLTNLGNRDATGAKYRYYLSANTIITTDDLPLMRVTSGGEVADGTVSLTIGQRDSAIEVLRMPQSLSAAQYFVGVLMDPDQAIEEGDETDNGLAGTRTDVVAQSLTIANPVLPDATVGLPYSMQLEGQGGAAPYTFTLADPASIPPGLMLSPSGAITGTPTQRGAYTLSLEVHSGTRTVVVARSLRVAPVTGSLAINATALPAPTRFVQYRATLGAAGGAGGYRYLLVDGILPVGLELSASGELSGTPTDALGTTRTFRVRVIDVIGNVDERNFSMTVVDGAPFTIRTRSLPDGQLGNEYLQSIVAVNPAGAMVSLPVRWAVISGALPAGLALESSESDTIVLSGTPTRPGFHSFTIEAVDGQGRTDAYTYFVTIIAGVVNSSATGPSLVRPGESVTVTFTAAPLPEGSKWFWREGRLPPGLTFSADGTVTGTVADDAPLDVYTFSAGVGLGADQLLTLQTWSIEVSTEKTVKSGCTTAGGSLVWLAALAWFRRRRGVAAR